MKAKHYLLITLAVAIFLLGYCTRKKMEQTQIGSDTLVLTEIEYVPTLDTFIKYVPKPYQVTEYDTVFVPDSASCIQLARLYYGSVTYSDTLLNDSTLFLVVNDSISRNRIIHRSNEVKRSDKVITNTITITNTIEPKMTAFGTLGSQYSFINQSHALTIGGGVIFKKYGIGAEYITNQSVNCKLIYKF